MRGEPEQKKSAKSRRRFSTTEFMLDSRTREILQANQEQKQSLAFVDSILASVPGCVFVTDQMGKIKFANQFANQLLGYDPQELNDSLILNLIKEAYDIDIFKANEQIHINENEVISTELELRHKNNDLIPCLINIAVLQNNSSNQSEREIIFIVLDIREKKEAEKKLEETHQKLLLASREAGMAEVATSILHNVGNVLNSVNVSASMMEKLLNDSKTYKLQKLTQLLNQNIDNIGDFLQNDSKGQKVIFFLNEVSNLLNQERDDIEKELSSLKENIEHIKHVIATQQSYAKHTGIIEEISVNEIIESALHLNNEKIKACEVKIIKNYENLQPVQIEKHKVLQIIVNLISNAVSSVIDAGKMSKEVIITTQKTGENFSISIEDNGLGISQKNLEKIFKHGFTTKKDGHGFGLHASANSAQQMGGGLTFSSDGPGWGATFILTLPTQPKQNKTDSQKNKVKRIQSKPHQR